MLYRFGNVKIEIFFHSPNIYATILEIFFRLFKTNPLSSPEIHFHEYNYF